MAFSRPPLPVSASPTAPTAHSSADASYRAAEKAATPSCFACRFSSDWHTASRLYHEAGAGFALERNWYAYDTVPSMHTNLLLSSCGGPYSIFGLTTKAVLVTSVYLLGPVYSDPEDLSFSFSLSLQVPGPGGV